jgi:uncharacterized damage-inducible protein DinB
VRAVGVMLLSMVQDLVDPRRSDPDVAFTADERGLLEAWLDFHRMTLLLKCEGLDDPARKSTPIPTSKLSLHGLVRHMAEVERSWFRRVLLDQPDLARIYDPDHEDSDLAPLDKANWEADLAVWQHEIEESRLAARTHELADTGVRRGRPCSLRWIYVHMIEEYARHNGHADLIRELIDGSVGW